MPSCLELQQEFLQAQSEIGALELKKIILFNKCVKLEQDFIKQKEVEDLAKELIKSAPTE